ncbi:MAG: DHH family phosphoesterase [Candidatus Micrarchaeia archaeon]|jgi:RecJ-like exonuclease
MIKNEISEKMKPIMDKIANEIKNASKIILRYHNDADGITGALAIYKALNSRKLLTFQNKGVTYEPGDALSDIRILQNESNPLVILTDFSTNSESKEARQLIKKSGIGLIIIDHHPTEEKIQADIYLSPWELNGNSFYTAGWMCCEIAKILGFKEADELSKIALTGDKSIFYKPTKEDKEKAIVLDYIGIYSRFPNTLEFYDSVLNDRILFTSISASAMEKLDEIAEVADKYSRVKEIKNIKLVILQLDKIVKRFSFPSKSKATGAVFDRYDEENKPFILIGYGERLITIRTNINAQEIGLGADVIVKKIKESLSDLIISGGGHPGASAMRIQKDSAKIIINEVLKIVERI